MKIWYALFTLLLADNVVAIAMLIAKTDASPALYWNLFGVALFGYLVARLAHWSDEQ